MEQKKNISERILMFMKAKEISSGVLADRIGVQRSGISHILSGRNKPSFDFLQKFLDTFREINAEWLLLGRGEMLKAPVQKGLFGQEDARETPPETKEPENAGFSLRDEEAAVYGSPAAPNEESSPVPTKQPEKGKIARVILLYEDGHFDSYVPPA